MPRSARRSLGTRPNQPELAQLVRAMDEVPSLLALGAGDWAVHGSDPCSNSSGPPHRSLACRKLSRGPGDCGAREPRPL